METKMEKEQTMIKVVAAFAVWMLSCGHYEPKLLP
jgi:hypothetical protein